MGAATVATPVVTTDVAALTAVADKFEKMIEKLSNPAPNRLEGMLNGQQPPGVTHGYNSDQKPFSLHRFTSGYKAKNDPLNLCPHEYEVCQKYTKALISTGCMQLPGEI